MSFSQMVISPVDKCAVAVVQQYTLCNVTFGDTILSNGINYPIHSALQIDR